MFLVLEMQFFAIICYSISVFDQIRERIYDLSEFASKSNGKFKNDVKGTPFDLLIALIYFEKIQKIDFQHIADNVFLYLYLIRNYWNF